MCGLGKIENYLQKNDINLSNINLFMYFCSEIACIIQKNRKQI